MLLDSMSCSTRQTLGVENTLQNKKQTTGNELLLKEIPIPMKANDLSIILTMQTYFHWGKKIKLVYGREYGREFNFRIFRIGLV